jgi:hypothetical protein
MAAMMFSEPATATLGRHVNGASLRPVCNLATPRAEVKPQLS